MRQHVEIRAQGSAGAEAFTRPQGQEKTIQAEAGNDGPGVRRALHGRNWENMRICWMLSLGPAKGQSLVARRSLKV